MDEFSDGNCHSWIGLRWGGCKASTKYTNNPWNSFASMDQDNQQMVCNTFWADHLDWCMNSHVSNVQHQVHISSEGRNRFN